jgi:hypothetical protein
VRAWGISSITSWDFIYLAMQGVLAPNIRYFDSKNNLIDKHLHLVYPEWVVDEKPKELP